MKNIYLIMLLSISSIIFSQEKRIKGQVFNHSNNEAIDYVYILDSNDKVLSITDENGYFKFNEHKLNETNFKLHKYGYKDTIINSHTSLDSIKMSSQLYDLDEVVIDGDVNKRYKYMLYFFKTYDFKNDEKRRY